MTAFIADWITLTSWCLPRTGLHQNITALRANISHPYVHMDFVVPTVFFLWFLLYKKCMILATPYPYLWMVIVIGHHYIVGVLLFRFDLYSHIYVRIFVSLWWRASYFKEFFFLCDDHLREICLQWSSSLNCIHDISFLP